MANQERGPEFIDPDGLLLPVDHPVTKPRNLDPSVWDVFGESPEHAVATQTGPISHPQSVRVSAMPTQIYDGFKDFRSPRPTEQEIELRVREQLRAEKAKNKRRNRRVVGVGLLALTLIAPTAVGINYVRDHSTSESSSADDTLPPITDAVTTTVVATTIEATTTTLNEQAATTYTVKKGDTLIKIAQFLSELHGKEISVSTLMLYNGISDPDVIREGQTLIFSGPIPTTTTVELTTTTAAEVPSTTAPATTAPTTPATTVPATAPPTTVPNDGKLSAEECISIGGVLYSFNNETFIQHFKKLGFTEKQAFLIYNSVKEKFKIVNIYGDVSLTDKYDLRECIPTVETARKILGI